MINTNDLERLISLTLASAYVKGEKPISLMMVSDRPESGKTTLANKFIENKRLAYLSDITAYAMWRDFAKEIEAGDIKHFIIPEFLAPLSRTPSTVASFVATLQMLIEEGIMEIHTGFLEPMKLAAPTTIGAIVCLPRNSFDVHRFSWEMSGFLSRFMVVTYKYNDATIEKIFDSIMNREYFAETKISLSFPDKASSISIPKDIALKARALSHKASEKARQDGKLYGFRELKNIMCLLAANVVLENMQSGNNRTKVNQSDYQIVEHLSYYLNEDFNALRDE